MSHHFAHCFPVTPDSYFCLSPLWSLTSAPLFLSACKSASLPFKPTQTGLRCPQRFLGGSDLAVLQRSCSSWFSLPVAQMPAALIDPSSASGPSRSVRCQISSSSYCLCYLRATLCRFVKHDVRRGVPADELRLSELRRPRGHLRTVGASSPQPSADNDSPLPARPVVPRVR